MREAVDELAAGMMAVGLDHWPAVLRESDSMAKGVYLSDAVSRAPGQDEVSRVFRIGSVRISGGSADLVAGPSDLFRGVPTPKILEVERKIDAITEAVKDLANPLVYKGMSPRVLGTMLHAMFKKAVDDAIRRGELPREVRTETSWAHGADKRYGEKGAKRTDIVLMEGGKVIAIWDYKTGAGSTISERRVDDLRQAVTRRYVTPTAYFNVLHVPFHGPGS